MTSVLIERATNGHLLIVQDNATGRRNVIAIPFNGKAEGYEQESDAVQFLMSLVVDQELTAEAN